MSDPNPITKVWHFSLKPAYTSSSPDFLSCLSSILDLCKSYSDPSPSTNSKSTALEHVFYQSTTSPSQGVMISGYESLALNRECDAVYAEQYMSRMFEFVEHVWLKMMEVDVRGLSLGEMVVVTCSDGKQEGGEGAGGGGWDVWPSMRQPLENEREGHTGGEEEREWVQVTTGGRVDADGKQLGLKERFILRKIVGR